MSNYFDDLILKKLKLKFIKILFSFHYRLIQLGFRHMIVSYIMNQWNSITNIYFYWNYSEQCSPKKKLNLELLQGVQGDGFRPEPSKLVKLYPKKQTLLPYLQRINVKIQVDSQVTILRKIRGNSQESFLGIRGYSQEPFTGKSGENVDSFPQEFLVTHSQEPGPRNFL